MITRLITGPTGEVLTLDEAKDHLVVDHTLDDSLIRALIQAAVTQAEDLTNRRLLTQTWRLYLQDWPSGDEIILPYGQLQSVTSVTYLDDDGVTNTLAATTYTVDTDSEPARIVLEDDETWPTESLYPANAIIIEFVCGYGAQTKTAITAASNASPIVIGKAGHGLSTGDRVVIESIVGNTAANAYWNVTKVTDDTFSLNGSTGNAAYVSGGTFLQIEVPEALRTAIKLMVGDMYAHRETLIIGQTTAELPNYILNLLGSYRLWGAA